MDLYLIDRERAIFALRLATGNQELAGLFLFSHPHLNPQGTPDSESENEEETLSRREILEY